MGDVVVPNFMGKASNQNKKNCTRIFVGRFDFAQRPTKILFGRWA